MRIPREEKTAALRSNFSKAANLAFLATCLLGMSGESLSRYGSTAIFLSQLQIARASVPRINCARLTVRHLRPWPRPQSRTKYLARPHEHFYCHCPWTQAVQAESFRRSSSIHSTLSNSQEGLPRRWRWISHALSRDATLFACPVRRAAPGPGPPPSSRLTPSEGSLPPRQLHLRRRDTLPTLHESVPRGLPDTTTNRFNGFPHRPVGKRSSCVAGRGPDRSSVLVYCLAVRSQSCSPLPCAAVCLGRPESRCSPFSDTLPNLESANHSPLLCL